MTYEEFAADLTSSHNQRFHSVDELEDTFRALGASDYHIRQLGRGSFRTDLTSIQTSEGLAVSHRFERSFYAPLHAVDGMVTLLITSTAGEDLFASGEVVSNDKLVVQTPGTEVDVTAPDLTGADAFCVPESRFYSLLETICPGGPSIRPGQMVAVAGDKDRLYRLRRAINALVTQSESDPHHERQANLIAEVIAWMGDSDSQWRPQGFPVSAARVRIARQARDYMEDRFPYPIRLEDLCRETGVSLRTMQRAFVEYFQISPYAYLKKLRLDRARRELHSGAPATHLVTDVALKHGYSHLSRFARAYHEAFGELPSETLAR